MGRASPKKASECLVRHRLCRRWVKDDAYPGSMHVTPDEAKQEQDIAGLSPDFPGMALSRFSNRAFTPYDDLGLQRLQSDHGVDALSAQRFVDGSATGAKDRPSRASLHAIV